MSFADRFELLDLLRDGEVQTFHARERSTGRDVEAHFSRSSELLAKIDSLNVIARGSHEGKLYVVTTPLGLDAVGAWRIKPAEKPGEFTQMFQLRQAPEPVAAPASRAVQTPAASEAGEFTRVFKKPAAAPAALPAGSGEPGEFTRMFQKPAATPVAPTASEALEAGVPAARSRVSVGRVVAAIVIIWAIAVFLVWRTLY